MPNQRVFHQTLLVLLALAVLLSACAPGVDTRRDATVTALAKRVSETATASNVKKEETSAPANVISTATAVPISQTETSEVQSSENAETAAAIRETERPILAELPRYNVDPEKGRVAWVQGPMTLEVEGQDAIKADNAHPGTIAADFVLSANITWDTQFGDSGCGYVFRSDGDQVVPTQYLLLMTRLASGHILFTVMVKGDIINFQDIFPKQQDRRFSSEKNSTNQLTVVGRGTIFEVYTNRILIATVNPNDPPTPPVFPTPPKAPNDPNDKDQKTAFDEAQARRAQEVNRIQEEYNRRLKLFAEANKEFPTGFVSMIAVTQGGKATCTFDNAWLWLIED